MEAAMTLFDFRQRTSAALLLLFCHVVLTFSPVGGASWTGTSPELELCNWAWFKVLCPDSVSILIFDTSFRHPSVSQRRTARFSFRRFSFFSCEEICSNINAAQSFSEDLVSEDGVNSFSLDNKFYMKHWILVLFRHVNSQIYWWQSAPIISSPPATPIVSFILSKTIILFHK